MASYLNPQPSNAILDDIVNIRELENYNAQSDPSLGSDFPVGAKRFVNIGTPTAPKWQWQRYDGTSWQVMANTSTEKLMHNVDMLDGYHASTSAVANSIPVYNADKLLVGGITGNAATATKLATARNIQVGGIASGDAKSFNGTAAVTLPINSINVNNAEDDAIVGVLTAKHGGTGRTDGAAQDVIINSLSGAVKAKEYGKIGQMPSNYLNADLNTLVIPGVYQVNTENGEIRHHPMSFPSSFAVVRVEQQGSFITQEYQMYNPMLQFVRRSANAGATWSGWYSMGGARNGSYTLYISKSGSDSNTGFSSENPVLTIERAIRIAEGLSVGKSDAYVCFCIGEGSWGQVTFSSLPFTLRIRPFDGTLPTEYSTSLPVFTNIQVQNSFINIGGIVSNAVQSFTNAYVYFEPSYNRIGAFRARQGGTIYINGSSSSPCVIDVFSQSTLTDAVFNAYNFGTIFMGYARIKLLDNISMSQGFFSVQEDSYVHVYAGRTIIDVNGMTFTGRKLYMKRTGRFDTEQTGESPSFIDTIPGTDITKPNGAIVNGYTVGQASQTDLENVQSSANAAQSSANAAQSSANAAQSSADAKLPLSGGTLTGEGRVNWRSGGRIKDNTTVIDGAPLYELSFGFDNGAKLFCRRADSTIYGQAGFFGFAAYVDNQDKWVLFDGTDLLINRVKAFTTAGGKIDGPVTVSTLKVDPGSGEGGQIDLYGGNREAQRVCSLDTYNNTLRFIQAPSPDGSITGVHVARFDMANDLLTWAGVERSVKYMGFPLSKYIDVQAVNGSSYTAPANGFFTMAAITDSSSTSFLSLENTTTWIGNRSTGPGNVFVFIPMKKGDVVRMDYNRITSWYYCRFVYGG